LFHGPAKSRFAENPFLNRNNDPVAGHIKSGRVCAQAQAAQVVQPLAPEVEPGAMCRALELAGHWIKDYTAVLLVAAYLGHCHYRVFRYPCYYYGLVI
jgi:hypothetical protein